MAQELRRQKTYPMLNKEPSIFNVTSTSSNTFFSHQLAYPNKPRSWGRKADRGEGQNHDENKDTTFIGCGGTVSQNLSASSVKSTQQICFTPTPSRNTAVLLTSAHGCPDAQCPFPMHQRLSITFPIPRKREDQQSHTSLPCGKGDAKSVILKTQHSLQRSVQRQETG